jgi:DNA-binding transcriptional regulator YiaG
MTVTVTDRVRAAARVHRDLPAPDVRRRLRLAAGMTQREVGAAIGVTSHCVAQWERGIRTPRGAQLVAYVEALNALRALAAEAV